MRILTFALLILSLCAESNAQRLPAERKILGSLRLANRYFMEKWPDAGKPIFTNIQRPSNIWTRSVYYEGLIELYRADPQQTYLDYMLQWGEKHQWGLRGGTFTRNADNQCCGQIYLDLYELDGRKQPIRATAIRASIDSMLRTQKIDDWNWIDALQMAMPVFVKLGNIYNNPAYHQRMYEMYAFTKNRHGGKGLYNPAEGLWWRDKDFVPPYREPNGEDCYWSRGNGWVVAALVRTLSELPQNDPHRDEYLKDFKDMCQAVLKVQRQDGFWNVSLHDPNHFGGKELSGTALFTYGFAWGIRNGHLDAATYMPSIRKAWKAMQEDCVHPNGKLGFVQGTGKEPKDGQPVNFDSTPDFEDYGLGCFLLAGTEIMKLKKR